MDNLCRKIGEITMILIFEWWWGEPPTGLFHLKILSPSKLKTEIAPMLPLIIPPYCTE